MDTDLTIARSAPVAPPSRPAPAPPVDGAGAGSASPVAAGTSARRAAMLARVGDVWQSCREALDTVGDRMRPWRRHEAGTRLAWARAELATVRAELASRELGQAGVREAAERVVRALRSDQPADRVLAALDGALVDALLEDADGWLGPALVAVRALAAGDAELGARAGGTALGRDVRTAALFLAVASHRCAQPDAAVRWLAHGLAAQDVDALDPAALAALDAAIGAEAFGPEGRAAAVTQLSGWLEDVATRPGHAERELRRWSTALAGLRTAVSPDAYPALRALAPRWDALERALADATLAAGVEAWCAALPTAERGAAPLPAAAPPDAPLRALLDRLAACPDPVERALHARARAAERLVAAESHAAEPHAAEPREREAKAATGNGAAAGDLSDPAAWHEDGVPLPQLLATIALAPERVGASPALRRLAVRASRAWILAAFDGLAADARAAEPPEPEVRLGEWEGRLTEDVLRDQKALHALGASYSWHMGRRAALAVAAEQMPGSAWGGLGAGLLLVAIAIGTRHATPAVGGVVALAWWLVGWRRTVGRRARAQARVAREQARGIATLRDAIEEFAAHRACCESGHAALDPARARLRETLAAIGDADPERARD